MSFSCNNLLLGQATVIFQSSGKDMHRHAHSVRNQGISVVTIGLAANVTAARAAARIFKSGKSGKPLKAASDLRRHPALPHGCVGTVCPPLPGR
jgi:hypothetical protein